MDLWLCVSVTTSTPYLNLLILAPSISSVVYYGINRVWPQTVSLVDEATYPLQLGETLAETPSSLDGEEVGYLKDPTITKEKEIV
jgi:hypothetical protein